MTKIPDTTAPPESFEERIARLEEIVEQLERGQAPLEDSLALFEEGVGLANACQQQLEQARQRVEVLLKETEGTDPETAPYTGTSQDDT